MPPAITVDLTGFFFITFVIFSRFVSFGANFFLITFCFLPNKLVSDLFLKIWSKSFLAFLGSIFGIFCNCFFIKFALLKPAPKILSIEKGFLSFISFNCWRNSTKLFPVKVLVSIICPPKASATCVRSSSSRAVLAAFAKSCDDGAPLSPFFLILPPRFLFACILA